MNQTEGKPQSGHFGSLPERRFDPKWVASDDSRSQPEAVLELPKEASEGNFLTDYHLTARIVNSQLTVRQLSLILEVLEYQIVNWGCNFAMFLTLVEIYSKVMGQKLQADEINDGKVRLTALVSEILIREFKGQEFSLDSREFLRVEDKVKKLLQEYIMDKRTYGSRFAHWRPERFIRIRAVPVNVIFERPRVSNSERYSSYTKGYGESHPSAHRKKTKPSQELDGESSWPDGEQRNLILRVTDWIHQKANALWINYRNLKE